MSTTSPPNSWNAETRQAASLVRDLFRPDPRRYWTELVGSSLLSWLTAAVAIAELGGLAGTSLSIVAAAFAWHRATVMSHELTHQRRGALPGFHLAWNLAIGVPFLFPSAFYERVHANHHRRKTYGTLEDPEYLPLAGRPGLVAWYLASAFLLQPLLLLRFLVVGPLSWCVPRLRRIVLNSGSTYTINPRFVRNTLAADRLAIFVWELVIAAVWWPLIACTIAGVWSWHWVVIVYLIHTSASLINRLRMMTAHRFESDGHATELSGQIADSIDSPQGWWAELWAPLGLRYHALHHLFPALPFHSMSAAYHRLNAGLPTDAVYRRSTGTGWLNNARNLLRRNRPTRIAVNRPTDLESANRPLTK